MVGSVASVVGRKTPFKPANRSICETDDRRRAHPWPKRAALHHGAPCWRGDDGKGGPWPTKPMCLRRDRLAMGEGYRGPRPTLPPYRHSRERVCRFSRERLPVGRNLFFVVFHAAPKGRPYVAVGERSEPTARFRSTLIAPQGVTVSRVLAWPLGIRFRQKRYGECVGLLSPLRGFGRFRSNPSVGLLRSPTATDCRPFGPEFNQQETGLPPLASPGLCNERAWNLDDKTASFGRGFFQNHGSLRR